MKICLPVDQINGLDSAIAASFRAATTLMLVDSQTLACQPVDASNGSCSAVPAKIDAIIFSDGIGRGMFNGLKQNGIRVFSSTATTVRSAMIEFASGRLQEVHDMACCGGDGHEDAAHAAHSGCGCSGQGQASNQAKPQGGGCCGKH
jgi:predicted Fe-Mo cluster-binding NifX family protein